MRSGGGLPTSTDVIADVEVRALQVHSGVPLKDGSVSVGALVRNVAGPVLLCFFRRFGCPVCRMSAVNLGSLAAVFEARGGTIIGFAPNDDSAVEFLTETRWGADLYTDDSGQAYRGLALKKKGCGECWGFCVCCSSVGTWSKKASKLGYKGNFSGNLTQWGGTLLVEGGTGRVLYAHKQTDSDFEPDVSVILDKLNATAEERQGLKSYQPLDSMK